MASIWDFFDSLPKRSDVTPEELARRRQGYADLYQGGLLAGNRDQMPLSVQGAQATQDFLPVIGDALALGEAGEALSRGELAAAGLLGAGAAIGLVPGAGDALAKPVMAAGRRAADIARRIEVDPNALGSMGGNIRLKPQASIEDQVAAARKAVIDSPNDENLFLEYKRLRKMRDEGVSTFPQAEAPAPQVGSGLLGDYVGQHRAPTRDAGAPAFSLAGDIYPDDIYSSKAVQYYGTGSDAMDRQTMGLLQSLRGKPDADVTIYRAVPKGVDNLNAGDWVTVSKQYAEDHGESALGGDFDIIEKKVKAKDIFTNGDSIHEFGYDPATPAQEAPMEIDVWHGTPHEFPPAIRVLDKETGKTYVQAADDPIATGMIAQQPNRYEIVQENPLGMFDFSKMGTGEGAQAYGWGGYQAQRRGIAQSYRDQLTDNAYGDRRIYSLDGQDLPELTFIQKQVAGGLPPEDIVANRKKRIGLLEARIKDAPALSKGDDLTPSDFSRMSDEIDLKKMREEMAEAQSLVGKRIESRDPGALYQSKIMANPDEFMSWERPISEQAPNVREAFGLEGKVRDLIDRRKGLLDAYTSAADPAPAGDFDSLFYENPTQKKLISELEKVDSEIKNTPFGLLARDFSSAEIDRIGRLTGQDAYEALTDAAGALDWPVGADSNQRRMFQSQGKENASKMLNEFGIPGSTHIDAAARSAPYQVNLSRSGVPYETDPIVAQSVEEANQLAEMYRQKGFSADVADVATRNFVVFDENLINIVKKYGIAGAAAMLGVSAIDVEQAMAQGYQPQQPQSLLSQGAR